MVNTLKIALVDDEPLALASLQHTLSDQEHVEIIGTFTDGQEALVQLPRLQPELVFLDIQMPGLNGLQVAEALVTIPGLSVVFVTAFSEHALEAFRVHALNYILKPYQDEQIIAVIDRIRQSRQRQAPTAAMLLELMAQIQTKRPCLTRILVKEGRRSLIVQTTEIMWIGAARNYLELHTPHKTYLYRCALDQLEAKLDPTQFVRIHRSNIVNLDEVICLEKPGKNQMEVVMRDGSRLTVSSKYRPRLEAALKP